MCMFSNLKSPVYNEQASRNVVGACCSVYVAECSEVVAESDGVFTSVVSD